MRGFSRKARGGCSNAEPGYSALRLFRRPPPLPCNQFARLVCAGLFAGNDEDLLDGIDPLDEACGAGTSELDLSAADYATIIEEAVFLLNPTADLAIPEEDMEAVCQVREGGKGKNSTVDTSKYLVYNYYTVFVDCIFV